MPTKASNGGHVDEVLESLLDQSTQLDETIHRNTSTPSTSSEIPVTESPIASPKDDSLLRFEPPPPGVSILPMIEKRLEEAIQNVEHIMVKGRARLLCPACPKDFNDKAALRIHYPAVHMRTMYRCTIPGCGLWFTSKRSRNRHAQNTNPELHSGKIMRPLPAESILIGEADDEELREAMTRARRKGISTEYPAPKRELDAHPHHTPHAHSGSVAMAGPLSNFLANNSPSVSKSSQREKLKRRGSTCSSSTDITTVTSPKVRASHHHMSTSGRSDSANVSLSTHTSFTSLLQSQGEHWDSFVSQFPSTDMDKPHYPSVTMPNAVDEWSLYNNWGVNSFEDFSKQLLRTLQKQDVNGFFQGPCPLIGATAVDAVYKNTEEVNAVPLYRLKRNQSFHSITLPEGQSLKKIMKNVLNKKIKTLDSLRETLHNYFHVLANDIYPANSLPSLEAQRLCDLSESLLHKAVDMEWAKHHAAAVSEMSSHKIPNAELSEDPMSVVAQLKLINPDNHGRVSVKERIETIGEEVGFLRDGTNRLVADAKTSNVNCVIPYEYLEYGPYASFAPLYDSARSNCTHAESHLLLSRYPTGVPRLDPLAEEIIPEPGLESVLHSQGENDLSLYLLNAFSRSILRDVMTSSTKSCVPPDNVNSDAVKISAEKGSHIIVNVDLDAEPFSTSDEDSNAALTDITELASAPNGVGDDVQKKLDATGKLIHELNNVQRKRLLAPGYLGIQPSSEERTLAHATLRNLVDLTSKCSPGEVVHSAAVRKALNHPL